MDLKSNKIAWLASWPDNEQKIEQILSNAILLKKNGWDVGLVTQYPDLQKIDFSLLDHVIYDNTNEMFFSESKAFKFGFKRIIPSCIEMRQECGNLVFVNKKSVTPHLFSVIRLYAISMHMSAGYGYKAYAYFEADFWGTQKLCDLINEESERIISQDLNFIGFDFSQFYGSINACFFMGNPKILSHHFPLNSVKSENDFYRTYQNGSVEDFLMGFFNGDHKSIIYSKDDAVRFLGEYGKDWDTSHTGFTWLDNVTERTLAAFTTSAPFLKKTDSGYSLYYLMKRHYIHGEINFSVKITLMDDLGDNESVIFEQEILLGYNVFWFWEEIFNLSINPRKKIRIQTKRSCLDSLLSEDYFIKTDPQELAGYYSIRSIE